ncbi:MAG: serine hydrolase [Acidobacteriota bacterium]
MIRQKLFRVVGSVVVVVVAGFTVQLGAEPVEGQLDLLTHAEIDALAERAMERFQTPGIAIGVVSDGELVYAKGHGVLEIGKPETVDADTIFQIASVTKAFTAAALGILADEGKLGFDDPVIDHLPEYRMSDPWVTREFTIRDLLTHRSGLPLGAGDLLFWPKAETTRQEVVEALRHLEPETSFRTAYAYDNLLYIVAGEVVATVSGMPWEDFVEERILGPLGMDGCRALPSRVAGNLNRATPHMLVDGDLVTTFFSEDGAASAAGGINCNVTGLAKWVAMHLAGGALPNGERLLSEETHAELFKPVTLMSVGEVDREHGRSHFAAYALGWRLKDFHGYLHEGHSGGLQGMTCHLALLPELDVAAIALTNQWSRASRAVTSEILQSAVSSSVEDWVEIYSGDASDEAEEARKTVEEMFAGRNAESTPSLELAAYAGTYRDPWYGDVFVEWDGDSLVMRFSRSELLTGDLEHFQYDTFVARWRDRSLHADAFVSFRLGADGEVESIDMKAVSPDTDFSYDFHDLDLHHVKER